MPEFILEAAGEVKAPKGARVTFENLTPVAQGYVEALFFTECAPQVSTEEFRTKAYQRRMEAGQTDGRIPGDVGFADLHPDTLADIIADVAAFEASPEWLAALPAVEAGETPDEEQAGRDLWYTRNGHGCGFWDGDWPEPHGDALSKAAKRLGEVDVYFYRGKVRI